MCPSVVIIEISLDFAPSLATYVSLSVEGALIPSQDCSSAAKSFEGLSTTFDFIEDVSLIDLALVDNGIVTGFLMMSLEATVVIAVLDAVLPAVKFTRSSNSSEFWQ